MRLDEAANSGKRFRHKGHPDGFWTESSKDFYDDLGHVDLTKLAIAWLISDDWEIEEEEEDPKVPLSRSDALSLYVLGLIHAANPNYHATTKILNQRLIQLGYEPCK